MPVLDELLPKALAVVCAKTTSASLWNETLHAFMWSSGITTPRRIAAFVGQVAVESLNFTRLEEDLNYSADRLCEVWPSHFPPGSSEAERCALNPEDLANTVYADRLGNGPASTGDGWRYRGAGLIQLTGKANQTAFAKAAKMDPAFVGDYLRTAKGGAHSACWFWDREDLNLYAEAWLLTRISWAINGGGLGLAERIALCNRVRSEIGARQQ